MIDTVHTLIPSHYGFSPLQNVDWTICGQVNAGSNKWGEYVSANLGNLRLTATDDHLRIMGSWPRYWLGSNLFSLWHNDTMQLVSCLSDQLNAPVSNGLIYRLDKRACIPTHHKPGAIFSRLMSLKGYSRLEQGDGLYYKKGMHQVAIYDKLKEMRRKRKGGKNPPIPEHYQSKEVLVIESRHRYHYSRKYTSRLLPLQHLLKEEVYKDMADDWMKTYCDIQKSTKPIHTMKPTSSSKQLKEYLARVGLDTIGQKDVIKTIKEWQEADQLDRQQAYRLRLEIEKLMENHHYSQEDEVIQHLNKAAKIAHQLMKG